MTHSQEKVTALPERVLTEVEFLLALGVSGNITEMAQRSLALQAHDRALRTALLDAERERDERTEQLRLADSVLSDVAKALGYPRWWPVPSSPDRIILERDSEKLGHIQAMPLLAAIADLAALREQVATLTAELDTLRASGGRVRGTARTLREERDAMVPLARLGLGGLDGGSYYLDVLVRLGVSKPTGEETPATIAARAILGRVP